MTERLDIKNMLVEPEQEPEKPFDLERDITPEQWEFITKKRQWHAEKNHGFEDIAIFAALETLRSGQVPEIPNERWEQFEREAKRWVGQMNESLIGSYAPYVIIDSLHKGQAPVPTVKQLQKIDELLSKDLEDNYWYRFAPLAIVRVLATGEPLQLSAQQWQRVENGRKSAGEKKWMTIFAQLATFEALNGTYRFNLKMGGGIELTHVEKKSADKENPPSPEQRKF